MLSSTVLLLLGYLNVLESALQQQQQKTNKQTKNPHIPIRMHTNCVRVCMCVSNVNSKVGYVVVGAEIRENDQLISNENKYLWRGIQMVSYLPPANIFVPLKRQTRQARVDFACRHAKFLLLQRRA